MEKRLKEFIQRKGENMKKILQNAFYGKSSFTNGLIAIGIISLIVLGCTCNDKKFDFGTSNSNSSENKTKEDGNPFETPDKKDNDFEKADASKGEIPSEDELQVKVKEDILRFNKALQDENFDDFYDSISEFWKEQTSSRKLKNQFQSFIDGKANLSGIKSLDADFSPKPRIDDSKRVKILEVNGEYATTPNKSTFELKYIPEDKEWKLIGLYVQTTIYKKK